MSGHSKWAQIKRQKAATDERKGQTFTKLGREIAVAVRHGGPDPEANFRLRLTMQRAREANMPTENIERAIKKAAGSGDLSSLEEISYEGYGPGGAALIIEVTTDNRNRAAAEVRNTLTRGGGNLGESGCVGWLFDARGVITVDATGKNSDDIALQAIDAGAEDFKVEGSAIEIFTQPAELDAVRRQLEKMKMKVVTAEPSRIPKTTAELDQSDALQVLKLVDRLEELDDVTKVYTNLDISEDLLEKYAG